MHVQDYHYFYVKDEKDEVISHAHLYTANGVQYITNVWTHQDYRKKGLATDILTKIIHKYGGKDIYLHVFPYTDQPLLEEQLYTFYAKFGFVKMDFPGGMVRKANTLGYKPYDDTFIMCRNCNNYKTSVNEKDNVTNGTYLCNKCKGN